VSQTLYGVSGRVALFGVSFADPRLRHRGVAPQNDSYQRTKLMAATTAGSSGSSPRPTTPRVLPHPQLLDVPITASGSQIPPYRLGGLVNVRKVTVRGWLAVVATGVVVSCAGSTTADDQFMSRLAAAGINGDRATLIADARAQCDWARHQIDSHDMAGIGDGIKLMNKIRSDGAKTNDQWGKFAEAAGDIYCPELKQHGDQNPLGGTEKSSPSVTVPSSSEPPPPAGATMSRDQIEHFRTRAHDAIDEINPAKDT
jgi:hypothetical protein